MTVLKGGVPAPETPFPVLPLRNGVVFPGTSLALTVGRPRSLALLHTLHVGDVLGVVTQRDPKIAEPQEADVYDTGAFARIVQIARHGNKGYRLVLEGIDRMHLERIVTEEPFWRAEGRPIVETEGESPEARVLAEALRKRLVETVKANGGSLQELPDAADAPGVLADRVAAGLLLDSEKAVELLKTSDVPTRLRRLVEWLSEAELMAEMRSKIERDVRDHFGKAQREVILRQQLAAIRRELGETDDADEDSLRGRVKRADLPEEVRKIADRELKRLESAGEQGPETSVIRSYLEWLVALPWNRRATVSDDVNAVAERLDADHTGLDDVKKRILEQLAVHKLAGNARGTILCLVGPPGVGKTSLGQSIAAATGRPFVRIALGGVRDEAEVRGHRRTYIGALPGRIIHALRKAQVKNPVLLLDEIDKLGVGFSGSPEAALLEVLDPEQNSTFTDHYLETAFDLSEVMFICTANSLETISPPLRDRLEIVEISGYTEVEKLAIARKHLVSKRLKETGLVDGRLMIEDAALLGIIRRYTREAGVRQLDRAITRLGRAVALEVARAVEEIAPRLVIDEQALPKYLGKPRFDSDVAERTLFPGVATGLAWTPFGGDILFVETSRMPGKGRLEITGQLGDVMKESARAALSYVRSHSHELEVESSALDDTDLHIHVPAGAVPKDGPSAGVTMFTALVSLLTGRRVRADTAMTGEATLRGRVLPVGGIKAKVLAAHRAHIRRVILPRNNERDLDEVPEETRQQMEFVLVGDMREALAAALEDAAIAEEPLAGSNLFASDARPPSSAVVS